MDRDYASYDDVPYHSRWRHFEVGGLDRTARLKAAWDSTNTCDDLGMSSCSACLEVTSLEEARRLWSCAARAASSPRA